MVLRGAQFQRSGPAGCTFLTRRAFPSCYAMFVQGRFDTVCLPQRSLITRRRLMRSTAEIGTVSTLRRTRVTWRESVTYVMGILGDCNWHWSINRDADCLHAPARFEWQGGPAGIEARCRRIG